MKPVDAFVLFVFIRRLVRPFKDWPAYKLGLIDEHGNFIVPKNKRTDDQKDSVSYLDKLIINLKRLLAKVPGGATMLATYAAALYLLHESIQLKEDVEEINLADKIAHYLPMASKVMEEVASTNMSGGQVADKGGELMQAKRDKIKRLLPKMIDESLMKPAIVDKFRGFHLDDMSDSPRFRDSKRNWFDVNGENFDGWTVLGSGVGGYAFSHPKKNYIIKIFKTGDAGYKLWLAFCERNQNNPFVPKLRGKPTPINTQFMFVRIEKLYPDHSGKAFKDIWEMIDWAETSYGVEPNDTFPGDPSLRPAILKVMSFLNNARSSLDLHKNNIMVRANGQPVIIDPLYHPVITKSGELEWILTKFGNRADDLGKSRFVPPIGR